MSAQRAHSHSKKPDHLKSLQQEIEDVQNEHNLHDDAHEMMEMMGGGHKKHEDSEGWLVSYADLMTLLMGFFALIASFSKPDAKEFEKVSAAASQFFGGEYEAPYEALGNSIRRIIKENNLEDQVKVDVNIEGVTMTFSGTLFFDSGGYLVKPQAEIILSKLIPAMKAEKSPLSILIEGHTDNTPIRHSIISSNWELSGIRASRIAQHFEKFDFKKEQLTIMGWGETKPLAQNANDDGSLNLENQAKNRRVVIRVYKELPK